MNKTEFKASEFMKEWDGISNDNRNSTFYKCDTVFKFAEEYADQLLQAEREAMFLNMQYYMEFCLTNGYITPQNWITNQS